MSQGNRVESAKSWHSNTPLRVCGAAIVAHTFDPSSQEIEAGGSLSLRTARSSESFRTAKATKKLCPEKPKK